MVRYASFSMGLVLFKSILVVAELENRRCLDMLVKRKEMLGTSEKSDTTLIISLSAV